MASPLVSRAHYISGGPVLGYGTIGGDPPPVPNPADLDGRGKILNEPARVRIIAVDRRTWKPIASTISAADGTWRIHSLDETGSFLVVAVDQRGAVNAAVQDWVTPHVAEP